MEGKDNKYRHILNDIENKYVTRIFEAVPMKSLNSKFFFFVESDQEKKMK